MKRRRLRVGCSVLLLGICATSLRLPLLFLRTHVKRAGCRANTSQANGLAQVVPTGVSAHNSPATALDRYGFVHSPSGQLFGRNGERRDRSRIVLGPGLIEPAVFGAVFFVLLARPVSAPGPTKEMLQREKEARMRVEKARKIVDKSNEKSKPKAQQELQSALTTLTQTRLEMKMAMKDLEEYPEPAYLKPFCGKKVMIAVTGASGVGKSSWINAIRRLRPRDPGVAKTGITETTNEPTMYSFPMQGPGLLRRALEKTRSIGQSLMGFPANREDDPVRVGDRVLLRQVNPDIDGQVAEVVCDSEPVWEVKLGSGQQMQVKRHQITGVLVDTVLWDLPGVGTPDYPQVTYLKKMGIRHFDMVVVMTAARFTEAELMLVNELRYWKVPFFLVRNKVDVDVQNEIDAEEDYDDEELSKERLKEVEARTIQTIRDDFKSKYGIEYVYCISTKRKLIDQFDFVQLERDMEEALKKQRGLTQSTETVSIDLTI